MNADRLAEILRLHALWLAGDGGERADLRDAYLRGANLTDADFRDANLTKANLTKANLTDANLTDTDLQDADLTEATMPDGRQWEEYRRDPIAGICRTPEVRERAETAARDGGHVWSNCPMHAAHGWGGMGDVPADLRITVAAFVAVYDSGLLDGFWPLEVTNG